MTYSDGNYFAKKQADKTTYELLTGNAKISSSPFSSTIKVLGPFALVDENYERHLCDMDGNILYDAAVSSANYDAVTGRVIGVNTKDKNTMFFTADGTLFLTVPEDDAHSYSISAERISASMKDGSDYSYYSVVDQDYTINGVSVGGTFISRRNSGGKCDLVDWLTGDNLLQGYDNYKLVGGGASWYVIATDNASKTATVYRLNK